MSRTGRLCALIRSICTCMTMTTTIRFTRVGIARGIGVRGICIAERRLLREDWWRRLSIIFIVRGERLWSRSLVREVCRLLSSRSSIKSRSCSRTSRQRWQPARDKSQKAAIVNLGDAMSALTLDVISDLLLRRANGLYSGQGQLRS